MKSEPKKTKYQRDRDALIKQATANAWDRVKIHRKSSELRPGVQGNYSHCFFSEFFHDEMNQLAFEHEITETRTFLR